MSIIDYRPLWERYSPTPTPTWIVPTWVWQPDYTYDGYYFTKPALTTGDSKPTIQREDTFRVNLDFDTSGIDAALEKVKELLKLMDKAGILPEPEDKE